MRKKFKISTIFILLLSVIGTNLIFKVNSLDLNQEKDINIEEINLNINIPPENSEGYDPDILYDHIVTFLAPIDNYSITLDLIKNHRYYFWLEVYMPDVEFEVQAELFGPDGNEDGYDDYFLLANGPLIENETEYKGGSFDFGAAINGTYSLILTSMCNENVNLYIFIEDKGDQESIGNEENEETNGYEVSDISGYSNDKSRNFYFDLVEDKNYAIEAQRCNSLPYNTSNFVFINATLYDPNDVKFLLLKNIEILGVFMSTESKEFFGISIPGQYRLYIELYSDVPVINLLVDVHEVNDVGNGSIDPIEDFNSTELDNNTIFAYIPEWMTPSIILGSFLFISFSIYYSKNKKRGIPKIV